MGVSPCITKVLLKSVPSPADPPKNGAFPRPSDSCEASVSSLVDNPSTMRKVKSDGQSGTSWTSSLRLPIIRSMTAVGS